MDRAPAQRPIMVVLDLVGRRWALRVIWELRDGPVPSFRELQSRCGDISSSVLSERLKELREAGIVSHDDSGYSLTSEGRELARSLLAMNRWADRWDAARRTGRG
jgi:DNA-binding HxlR family transcriptional regulator